MKRIILLLSFVLFLGAGNAQIEKLWTKSVADTSLPTWFSATGNTERGFAYNPLTNHLLVVSRNAGIFVRVIDANNGNDLGTLDVTGISGGTFALNDIEVSYDGVIYACNLVTDSASTFKIYRWANEAATPTVAFESTLGLNKRCGDNFKVKYLANNNTLQVWFAEAKTHKVYKLKTTDQGFTFVQDFFIQLPPATFGGAPSVEPLEEDSMIITKSSGKYIQAWSYTGALVGEIPGSIVATGATTIKLVSAQDLGSGFIASFQYGTGMNNVRLIDTDGEFPSFFRTYGITPSTGSNANGNGTGDIAVKFDTPTSFIIYCLATNNGIGAYRVTFPYIMNGRMHEKYFQMSSKLNNNAGFGPNIDIQHIGYNVANGKLYIALESKVDKTNNNGIVLFLGVSGQDGAPAGTALGAVSGGGHLFGVTDHPNYKNSFTTNYAFVLNPGGDDTLIYVDAAKYTSTSKTGVYLGACRQDGATAQGPSGGTVFTPNSISFGFDTAWGGRRGFEIAIPLSEIGNPPLSASITVFAAVVSSTAYFSDVTIPGNVTGGNPGFDVNFGTLPGGPYNSYPGVLPVELVSFAAMVNGSQVTLQWSTASELNNKGFEIERSTDGINFVSIGFITGKGTFNGISSYSFTDAGLSAGKYIYRLKQIDLSGEYEYSSSISAEISGTVYSFALDQNYPNPFNPETSIRFSVPSAGAVKLTVFDVLGNEVYLYNTVAESAGNYTININARELSSGTYFYRLEQGNNVLVKKMMLVK